MITYLYETIPQHPGEAPEQFTLRQSIKDAPLTRHPMGGAPVRRVIQNNAMLRSMREIDPEAYAEVSGTRARASAAAVPV